MPCWGLLFFPFFFNFKAVHDTTLMSDCVSASPGVGVRGDGGGKNTVAMFMALRPLAAV